VALMADQSVRLEERRRYAPISFAVERLAP
jgi:hypothetical protein